MMPSSPLKPKGIWTIVIADTAGRFTKIKPI